MNRCVSIAKLIAQGRKPIAWKGSVATAALHMAESKCGRISISTKAEDMDKLYFSKVVCNEKNYFVESFTRVFKPIFLLHPPFFRGLFWVQMEHDDRGYWTIYVLAQLSPEALMNTRASIRVAAPTKKGFSAQVKVRSALSIERRWLKNTGFFLCFHDS